MHSGISRHVALPFLAFAGLACFGLVRRSFSLSKTLSILNSKFFLLFNKPDVVDRISQLPDDILFSVISRLSIIDAVRTSILSRTWKNLYTFIHHVNFDYVEMYLLDSCGKPRAAKLFQEDSFFKYYPDSKRAFYPVPTTFNREEFVEAVDTFFQHYSGSRLVSFRLSCFFNSSHMSGFKRWMQSLCRLGVEELELVFCYAYFMGPFFSWHLLSEASSLEKVRLYGLSFQSELINQCYSFKILQFNKVNFAPGALECILSSCPSLRSLTIIKCHLYFSKVRIHSTKLTMLRIEQWIHSQVREIEFNAINLNSFEYIECERRRLTFTSVPSLERLSITLNGNKIGPSVFGQLIKDLPPVKSFYYENSGSDLQVYKKCELNNTLLRNLSELFFIVTKPESVLNITTILAACPLLQKFHLVLQTTESALFLEQKVEMSVGLHSQLEEVELSGFFGTWNEIIFALYILKSVVTLKQIRIIRCPKRYVGYGRWEWMENVETQFSEKQRRRIHELLQGQALSKSAQLIIHG